MDSGLVDTISGDKIYLFLQGGSDGRVGLDNGCAGPNAAGAVAFSISVNADTGAVTLTQNNSVVHNDPNDPVEAAPAAGMSAVLAGADRYHHHGDDIDIATVNIFMLSGVPKQDHAGLSMVTVTSAMRTTASGIRYA